MLTYPFGPFRIAAPSGMLNNYNYFYKGIAGKFARVCFKQVCTHRLAQWDAPVGAAGQNDMQCHLKTERIRRMRLHSPWGPVACRSAWVRRRREPPRPKRCGYCWCPVRRGVRSCAAWWRRRACLRTRVPPTTGSARWYGCCAAAR